MCLLGRDALSNDFQCSIDAHNTALTDETLAAAKSADAIILGAVGGPVCLDLHIRAQTWKLTAV